MVNYDFSGWATKFDVKCSDGRIIRKDAFKHHDGQKVPLVWNHSHDNPDRVLGQAILEHRDEGVMAYCTFNNSDSAQYAKEAVIHGDVTALSIYANQLKQQGPNVMHGNIREVSLVLAGANMGATIVDVIKHSDTCDGEAIIYCDDDESLEMYHADDASETDDEETIADVINSFTEKQKTVFYALLGKALKHDATDDDNEEDNEMKHNVFDKEDQKNSVVLSHADQKAIIELAKSSGVGSLKEAMKIYASEHKDTLAHAGWEDITQLFPDYKDLHSGAPELLERDQSWIGAVMRKTRKSPISRIRTRQADARANELRAKGYNDREVAKKLSGSLKLIMRTTDPQTVYRRDELHRDDIIDITDFDVVSYQKTVMKHNMEEEIALAALVGDGREDTDPDKIHEAHIRSVWNDDEMYTIHYDVDYAAAEAELQGTETGAHFGENYIWAEAFVTASLYSREKYKGKGQVDMYCTPHMLNVMLLARDLNGRRIYDSKADLAKALNVGEIHTVEQFEGLTRTTEDGKKKKLLALMVNMNNYQFGCTKGGELTNFEEFDIDFNKYKYLMETRLSGSLIDLWSAIALEEDVTDNA